MSVATRRDCFWVFAVCLLGMTVFDTGCVERDSADRDYVFDRDRWQSTTEDDVSVRREMITDLIDSGQLIGLTRDEVIEILGSPLEGDPSARGFPQWDSVYKIGLEDAGVWSLDDEALGLKFDDEGRVIEIGLSVN